LPDHNDAMTQEVTVQVSALGPEVSSGGVHMNLVPRDGGNVFSGALYAGYFDCDLAPGTTTCSTRVLPTNRDNIAQDNEIGPSNKLSKSLE
jgi:hypothetical protein